jgi:hypothetical protein
VHQVLSEEFLTLLTEEEKRNLGLRATVRKGRKKFYELIGPDGPPLVAVAGLKLNGWRCTSCDHRTWGYWVEGVAINSFVGRSDLPESLRGVFTVGVRPDVQLVATAPRWKELVGRKGTRGFASRLLGVAPDHEVVPRPELPIYEERLRERIG